MVDGDADVVFDDFIEPFTGKSAGLHVLVFAGIVDMLDDVHTIMAVADDGNDGLVGISARDRLRVGRELDEVLEQDLDHVIHSRAAFFGKVLEEEAAVS